MERINGPTATAAQQFTEGSSAAAVAPTRITASWLNNVQEEICNAITGFDIALDGEHQNQLFLAIQAAIANSPAIAGSSAANYWRGDKTWQPLNKAAVGLGNVDNTSDVNKPVSTAQAAAIQSAINAAISALIDGSPAALDTLKELADALNDDASFAASVTSALALKAPLASPALTGIPTTPTAAAATNNTQIGSTEFVQAAINAAVSASASGITVKGVAMQVGTGVAPNSGSHTTSVAVAFSEPFANACLGVWPISNTPAVTSDGYNAIPCVPKASISKAGATVQFDVNYQGDDTDNPINTAIDFTYIAFGY